jgi:hypothetical protein
MIRQGHFRGSAADAEGEPGGAGAAWPSPASMNVRTTKATTSRTRRRTIPGLPASRRQEQPAQGDKGSAETSRKRSHR